MADDVLTVSGAARELTRQLGREVRPQDISQLFATRILPDDLAPIVGGRRLIGRAILVQIANALHRKGRLGRPVEAAQ